MRSVDDTNALCPPPLNALPVLTSDRLVLAAWIWPWVGVEEAGDFGLGVRAMHYVQCAICYILCNMGIVCISLVLSTCCYVLCVVCCMLCAIHCAKCVYFLCFKGIVGNGAMHYALWAVCYILCNIRTVNISLVLSTFF